MGDTKLEISGRAIEDPPPSSYKSISESDTEETELQNREDSKNSMPKTNNSKEPDGADDKMLENESKPLTEESKIDIDDKLNDKQNGEAKLNIDDTKPAFVGMGKEELMKYANDPFWVRLRWILFVAFWLIWAAMLVGAIIIIIYAPKCQAPQPRTWYEKEIMVKVDRNNYNAIDSNVKKLKENKINTLVVKLQNAYKPLEEPENKDFVDFVKKMKNESMNVIIGLNPVVTDQYLVQSESSENSQYNGKFDKYASYYIWKSGRDSGQPPNNWVSPQNKSAWRYQAPRSKFVYWPGEFPTLNFTNRDVIEEFNHILMQWLELGVNGFMLTDVPYMFVASDFADETLSTKPGYIHTDYGFWKHTKTKNMMEISDVLVEWKNIVKSKTSDAVFMLSDDVDSLDLFKLNDTLIVDLPKHSSVFTIDERHSTAQNMYDGINAAFRILEDHWPLWEYSSQKLEKSVMNILTMLLPGNVLVEPSPDGDVDVDSDLIAVRNSDSILHGTYNSELLGNKTVFAYQRLQQGNPGVIVACNPSSDDVVVDFTSMQNVTDEVTVKLTSYKNETHAQKSGKVSPKDFLIPPESAVVLTYVPK